MAAGNLRRVLVQGRLAIGPNGVVWQNWKLNVAGFLRLFARDRRERSHDGGFWRAGCELAKRAFCYLLAEAMLVCFGKVGVKEKGE